MEILPSGLPKHVDDEEDLARFLTSSSQFKGLTVKHSAFLPNPKDGKKSVFRHGSEPVESLRQIGMEQLGSVVSMHGAAICKTKHVRAAQLEVVAEEPPPRHADIVGWPWNADDPEMGKGERKERAMLIAQHAEFVPL